MVPASRDDQSNARVQLPISRLTSMMFVSIGSAIPHTLVSMRQNTLRDLVKVNGNGKVHHVVSSPVVFALSTK